MTSAESASPWKDSPLIVTVAPNGAHKQATDHPALPLTSAALADVAHSCLDAGASMLHLHVRDSEGRHSLDVDTYRDATAAVRRVVGDRMVLQITSEAAGRYQAAEQMAMVRALHPEAVSIGLRELDTPETGKRGLEDFFGWLERERIMTQVILYDSTDVRRWQALCASGVVPAAPWFLLFVLGRYSAGQISQPDDLLPFLQVHYEAGQARQPWAVCAFGAMENACITAAAALGGHARVGFENNLRTKDGNIAPDNAALVQQVADAAQALGRPLAVADDIRTQFLGT
jgi:3-keto-5-aminohexanoate cleavage enzyme